MNPLQIVLNMLRNDLGIPSVIIQNSNDRPTIVGVATSQLALSALFSRMLTGDIMPRQRTTDPEANTRSALANLRALSLLMGLGLRGVNRNTGNFNVIMLEMGLNNRLY